MKILIVEDDRIIRKMMTNLLQRYGDCTTAENGLMAFKDITASWQSGVPYDLVFLDINMPVMDGFSALQLIRDFEEKKNIAEINRTKIIIVSSNNDKNSIIKAARHGIADYMTKPVFRGTLYNRLAKLGITPNN